MSNDNDIRQLSAKHNVNVLEEASYILWYIWRDKHTRYESLQACTARLQEDQQLYQVLKDAHRNGKYHGIRNWGTEPSSLEKKSIEQTISTFISELRPEMTRLVHGKIALPVWQPNESFEENVTSHLSGLRIPELKGKPNLLLHDLGSFQEDKTLAQRLENIFMANSHSFLVNTSGSGKTRLLLEGLCQHWGFYFTSLVDSSLLGSSDVQNAISTYVPDSPGFWSKLPPAGSSGYDTCLKSNRQIASRVFRQIFLARLLIFNLFVETMSGTSSEKHQVLKYRWLLLQLRPSLLSPQIWDIFDDLARKLADASDSFINYQTKALLSRVRTLLTEKKGASQTPLFCVLDEAQHAASQLSLSFRSDQNGAHRPILREIVRAWESQGAGHGVFMVVAGTGISKDVVDQAMASAIMKDSRYRWCSDTGAFDNMDIQRRYLRKYFPPSYLKTDAGAQLLERLWYWLHGRHRFTAGYVAEAILDGFKRPHSLLNAYIRHFSEFTVTDAQSFVKAEPDIPLAPFSQLKLDFSKLKKNQEMLNTIHQLTTHYLMRSVLLPLGRDEAVFVEYGFARFTDSETKTVAVDEPLVLLAATNWINANHESSYKIFARQIHINDSASNGFENYIAFCIDLIFSKGRFCVNEVFTFVGTPPSWTNQTAELISLHRSGSGLLDCGVRHSASAGPSVTFGSNAKSAAATSAWLDCRGRATICFPDKAMGPDLIFVLRLEDESLVWVALQAKYTKGIKGTLPRNVLRKAIRSVTPSEFFLNKDGNPHSPASYPDLLEGTIDRLKALPNRNTKAGSCSLLRVIVTFPADVNLKRCSSTEDPDNDDHPIAVLNMALVKQHTRKLSPVEYLQGLEGPLEKTGVKRKRGGPYAGNTTGVVLRKRTKLKI